MVPLVEMVLQESRVTEVKPAHLDLLVLQVVLVHLVRSDPPVNRETEERPDQKDLLDLLALLEVEECLDHKDHVEIRESLVIWVIEDRKDTEDSPDFRVCQGLLGSLVTRVLLDPLDQVEREDPQALLVHLEKREQMECLDPSDPLDLVVVLERLAQPVPVETPGPPVLLALQGLALTCLHLLVSLTLRMVQIPQGT